jgi:hypothetical protein
MSAQRSLERTVELVRSDIYPDASAEEVVASLTRTRVRLSADERELSSAAGQTALVTTAIVAAQSGIELVLDLADVPLMPDQPPLQGARLTDALTAHAGKLITPASLDDGAPTDLSITFGTTTARNEPSLRLSPTNGGFRLTPDVSVPSRSWAESDQFPALFGGVAAGAEAFRTAMRTLAAAGHRPTLPKAAREPLPVALQVEPPTRSGDLGAIDVISAGAITQGMLFALLRIPDIAAQIRVFDKDTFDWPNLNRYPLGDQGLLKTVKVTLLENFATTDVSIAGIQAPFDEALAPTVTLAPLVMVGVDHIPSRWLVQHHALGTVLVGATSHFEVVVSEHPPGEPCAGCLYRDGEDDGGEIPTVSFVSTFAGILQAHRLLRANSDPPRAAQLRAAPLNLAGSHPVMELGVTFRSDCPVAVSES